MSQRKALAAFIGACTAAALAVVVFTAAPAIASTTITISKTVCADGGQKYCYSPEEALGAVGVPVEWVNVDTTTSHTVAGCTSAFCQGSPLSTAAWPCGTLSVKNSGGTASCTFTTAGKYYYYCTLHGYLQMHGEITITGSGPTPTPTARPTPTPSHSTGPTPTPSHSSGPTPTVGATAPPTAVGATPTPVPVVTLPGQTPTASVSPGSTPSASPTTSGGQTSVVGTTPAGKGGGSGFPILIVIIAVVVIGAGGGAAVLIRRRSTA